MLVGAATLVTAAIWYAPPPCGCAIPKTGVNMTQNSSLWEWMHWTCPCTWPLHNHPISRDILVKQCRVAIDVNLREVLLPRLVFVLVAGLNYLSYVNRSILVEREIWAAHAHMCFTTVPIRAFAS